MCIVSMTRIFDQDASSFLLAQRPRSESTDVTSDAIPLASHVDVAVLPPATTHLTMTVTTPTLQKRHVSFLPTLQKPRIILWQTVGIRLFDWHVDTVFPDRTLGVSQRIKYSSSALIDCITPIANIPANIHFGTACLLVFCNISCNLSSLQHIFGLTV